MADNPVPLRQHLAPGTDTLEQSLRFLVARYARDPEPEAARAVVNHLTLLLRHPRAAEQPGYRAYLQRQLAHWSNLIAGDGAETAHSARWASR